MGIFHDYPYTDFHEMNLDWIISKIGDINKARDEAQASASAAKTSEENASASETAAGISETNAASSAGTAERAATAAGHSADDAANIVSSTVSQINLLQARVDEIIPDGTQTAGNTELLDIRVGANGITYDSAGNAVRGQYTDLADQLDPIASNFIELNVIDSANISYNKAIVYRPGPNDFVVNTNTSYATIINIPLKAGVSYAIGPVCRLLTITGSEIAADGSSYTPAYIDTTNHLDTFTYTPASDCFMHMSVNTDLYNIANNFVGPSDYVDRFHPYNTFEINRANSFQRLKLAGRLIYNFGDSVSAGYGAGNKGFSARTAEYNGMTCNEYAVSGATMGNYGSPFGSVLDQLASAPVDTPDFVVIAGGINDLQYGSDLGTVSAIDNYDTSALPDNKFCPALEIALSTALNKWVGAQVLVVFEHRMGSHLVNAIPVLEKTKEICKKWAVPLLNMYEDGGLNLGIPAYASRYGVGGDTHITPEAYETFYVPKLTAKFLELVNYVG